ncbi:hypothetical protein V525_14575 [Gordonia alkanivorans CGMCC 6845]|uniref:Uncharacterized protein n=1 Tax=Gordonia alkanivorans CGMCC 6845 TaxID=1423140 RepID=W9DIB9_9ACTN|nr:hypothetical protein V525_14575 [Gordonia alkanivorans CGMCC 6845]
MAEELAAKVIANPRSREITMVTVGARMRRGPRGEGAFDDMCVLRSECGWVYALSI